MLAFNPLSQNNLSGDVLNKSDYKGWTTHWVVYSFNRNSSKFSSTAGVQIILRGKCQQHLISLLKIEDLCILRHKNYFDMCSSLQDGCTTQMECHPNWLLYYMIAVRNIQWTLDPVYNSTGWCHKTGRLIISGSSNWISVLTDNGTANNKSYI